MREQSSEIMTQEPVACKRTYLTSYLEAAIFVLVVLFLETRNQVEYGNNTSSIIFFSKSKMSSTLGVCFYKVFLKGCMALGKQKFGYFCQHMSSKTWWQRHHRT